MYLNWRGLSLRAGTGSYKPTFREFPLARVPRIRWSSGVLCHHPPALFGFEPLFVLLSVGHGGVIKIFCCGYLSLDLFLGYLSNFQICSSQVSLAEFRSAQVSITQVSPA